MSIELTVAKYLDHQQTVRCVTPTTLENLTEDLGNWRAYLATQGVTQLSQVTPEVLDTWTAHEKDKGIAVNTWNRRATSIRSYLRYVHGRNLISHPLYEAVGRSKDQDRKPIVTLEPSAVSTMEAEMEIDNSNKFNQARKLALWGLMTYDGLRVGEVNRLNVDSVIEDQGIPALRVIGKGLRGRTVYLNPRSVVWLKNYLVLRAQYLQKRIGMDPGALIISNKLHRMSILTIQRTVKVVTDGEATPHTLRRTAVSETVNSLTDLGDLPLVADQFGHTTEVLQRHYLKPKAAKLQAIMARRGMKIA
jgi:integrase/recombinase XerC